MKGARWLLIRQEDLRKSNPSMDVRRIGWILIGVDHRLSEFKPGIHNRAIHLLLLSKNQETGHEGITKVIVDESGNLEDYLF